MNPHRKAAEKCEWCDKPAIYQDIHIRGHYVGACRAHKGKLAALRLERSNAINSNRTAEAERFERRMKKARFKKRCFLS